MCISFLCSSDLPGFSGVMDDKDEKEMEVDADSGTNMVAGTKRGSKDSPTGTPKKRPPTTDSSPSGTKPKMAAGTKRGSKDSPASTPKKRPSTTDSSPSGTKSRCKYGIKCYQKGKEHRDKFAHPWVRREQFPFLGV